MKNQPDRIFIDLGFVPDIDANFNNLSGCTWSVDNATGNGLEYVSLQALAEAEEKGRVFAEWCQNGPVTWHGFYCGWFYEYESIHTKENIKTTAELFTSPEFLEYYQQRKPK